MSLIKEIDKVESGLTPVSNMMSAIKEKGGEFHFQVTFSQEGWMATCQEFPQIKTWGEGQPSHQVITEATRDAIKSAFGIPRELDESFNLNKFDDPQNSYAPIHVQSTDYLCV